MCWLCVQTLFTGLTTSELLSSLATAFLTLYQPNAVEGNLPLAIKRIGSFPKEPAEVMTSGRSYREVHGNKVINPRCPV